MIKNNGIIVPLVHEILFYFALLLKKGPKWAVGGSGYWSKVVGGSGDLTAASR